MVKTAVSKTVKTPAVKGYVLLKNGTIVDGTGAPGYTGDVLLKGGKIEKVSDKPITAKGTVINCAGKVIAPGFIDVHSHMDWFLSIKGHDELKSPFLLQGITSMVTGNCGFSAGSSDKKSAYLSQVQDNLFQSGYFDTKWESFEGYRKYCEKTGLAFNMASIAGHGSTRAALRGFDSSFLKPAELKKLLARLEEQMEQGAKGVSLGLQYEPGIYSPKDELTAIARLVKKMGKLLTVHIRALSSVSPVYPIIPFFGTPHNIIALKEILDIARETGVRLQISHLIFVGEKSWKSCDKALAMIDSARKDGVDVMFDTYPYNCGASLINVLIPSWFIKEGEAAYKNPKMLRRLSFELELTQILLGFGYADIQITDSLHAAYNRYNGMFISEIAKERKMKPFDCFVDLARKSGGLARVLCHKYTNAEIVNKLISHPAALFMTDAWLEQGGVQNPSCFGAFPRTIEYARDRKLSSLEECIHKMTGASAARFDMSGRGILKEKQAADIVVFDPLRIHDTTTLVQTSSIPEGIDAVFINGKLAASKGKVQKEFGTGGVFL